MRTILAFALILGAAAPLAAQQHQHQSPQPYAGQQARAIKSLSDAEIRGLLNGDGMGFAKVAELNHYPGPRHVLELADRLALTPEQRAKTQALFERMRARAIELGERLVEEEAQLDRLFADARINDDGLQRTLHEIALTRAELRAAHLRAHLAMRELLTEHQIAEYDRLRGYTGGQGHGARHDH